MRHYFSDFDKLIIKHIISNDGVLLAILNFSELKSFANNAKIGSLLKFLLISYTNTSQRIFNKTNVVGDFNTAKSNIS